MPPRPRKKFQNNAGFNSSQIDKSNRMQLPVKIKCSRCNKVKLTNNFSKRQLQKFRDKYFINGPTRSDDEATLKGWIPCLACTGDQVTELQCVLCGETKGLDEFAKNQRKRDPDNAKCLECSVEHQNIEPGMGYREDRDSDSFDDDSDSSPSQIEDDDEDEISSKTENISLSTSQGVRVNPNLPAGVWQEQKPYRSFQTSKTTSGRTVGTQPASAFNPNAYGNPYAPRSAAGSSVASGPAQSSASKWKPEKKILSKTQAAAIAVAEDDDDFDDDLKSKPIDSEDDDDDDSD